MHNLTRLVLALAFTTLAAACVDDDKPDAEQLAPHRTDQVSPQHAAEMAQHHGEIAAAVADHGHALFAQLDTDHDGALTVAELQAGSGLAPMIATHLTDIDTDGDGDLVETELAAAIEHHHGAH